MRTKAKTLIEKHGFVDPDRKCTLHDQIQIWAFNNIETILQSISNPDRKFDVQYKTLEYPVLQVERNYSNIVGFVDLQVRGEVSWKSETGDDKKDEFNVSMEIKGQIESCGDLIRQINFYRTLMQIRSTWLVVSPDDRFKYLLRDQRIFFHKDQMPDTLRTGQLFS